MSFEDRRDWSRARPRPGCLWLIAVVLVVLFVGGCIAIEVLDELSDLGEGDGEGYEYDDD